MCFLSLPYSRHPNRGLGFMRKRNWLTRRWMVGRKERSWEAQVLKAVHVEAAEKIDATSSFAMMVARSAGGRSSRLFARVWPVAISGLATGFFELLPISSSLVIFCRLYRTCWFESCRRVCFDFPHVADFYWQYYIIKNNLNYIILENCLEYYICLRLPTIINEIIKLLYPCWMKS